MKKIAILVADLYQVLEVWYPYLRLREEGMAPSLVGMEKKIYYSKGHYPAVADMDIMDANNKADQFAGVIIPGGYAPDILRRYQEVTSFVKKIYDDKKVVATICHGGWVLISAGIVKNKNVTGFFAIKDDLCNAGAKFLNQEVVVDDKLITARQVDDLPFFCKKIIDGLHDKLPVTKLKH